ncbi:hypothetical protein POM88_053674 [Heracleum sosnowskyi]|uniref:Uncharacterized protein n=1 Tax=Heracleum sosnowskyi TaxID=360622 RepID=A0AAD8LVL3_9APIA|nr:hypothetical protein POM88_053674 [Heracleum sosnowskyi]
MRGKLQMFLSQLNQPITVVECPSPVISTRYINITSPNSSSSAMVFGRHLVYSYAYVVARSLDIFELEDGCRISKVAWVALQSPFSKVLDNFSEIHSAMVYGFELPWNYFYCLKCEASSNRECFCLTSPGSPHCYCEITTSPCDLGHLSSYHLSISCVGTNLNGIADALKSIESRRAFGDAEFEFNRTHIKAVLLDMLAATVDTAATTVDWTMSELLKHQQVMKKVQKELAEVVGMDKMVEESDLEKLDMTEEFGLVVRRANHLKAIPASRLHLY